MHFSLVLCSKEMGDQSRECSMEGFHCQHAGREVGSELFQPRPRRSFVGGKVNSFLWTPRLWHRVRHILSISLSKGNAKKNKVVNTYR